MIQGAVSGNDHYIVMVSVVASSTIHIHIRENPWDVGPLVFSRKMERIFSSLARKAFFLLSNVIFDVVGLSPRVYRYRLMYILRVKHMCTSFWTKPTPTCFWTKYDMLLSKGKRGKEKKKGLLLIIGLGSIAMMKRNPCHILLNLGTKHNQKES